MEPCLVPAERLCFGRLGEATPDRLQPEGADPDAADPDGGEPPGATRLSGHRGRAPPRPPARCSLGTDWLAFRRPRHGRSLIGQTRQCSSLIGAGGAAPPFPRCCPA
ncbi:hypothetical protein EK904_010276 [Melospiza melodia maxima]|nr:hypothetical protein EK904_010276 [Melospiza melodia maxima]